MQMNSDTTTTQISTSKPGPSIVTIPVNSVGTPFEMSVTSIPASAAPSPAPRANKRFLPVTQPNYPRPWGPSIPTAHSLPFETAPAAPSPPQRSASLPSAQRNSPHPWAPGIPTADPFATKAVVSTTPWCAKQGASEISLAGSQFLWPGRQGEGVVTASPRTQASIAVEPYYPWGRGVPTNSVTNGRRQVDQVSPNSAVRELAETSTPSPTIHANRNNKSGRDIFLGFAGAIAITIVLALLGTLYFRCRRGPSKKGGKKEDVEMWPVGGAKDAE
ncbi:hypothetical protein CC86DRAFT_401266 [Ophiobolus disseminans]|uniref:Uncharacterized protein n=1 Tax=Ophiobolus disseminans TaxID=1469910 RepID=A0A6A7AIG5_9PLEO|nr:hypothetical protein CC86DRAFT_401266 [Ophiobolus disseminans]